MKEIKKVPVFLKHSVYMPFSKTIRVRNKLMYTRQNIVENVCCKKVNG